MRKGVKKRKQAKKQIAIPWWLFYGTIIIFLVGALLVHTNAPQVKGIATVNDAYLTTAKPSFFQSLSTFFSSFGSKRVSPTPVQNTNDAISGTLQLGDNKASYTGPKEGYIYLCQQAGGNEGGAFQDGPWIQGSVWYPAKKVTVDGSIAWKEAKATFGINGTSRIITSNDVPSKHTTGIYPIQSSDDAYQYDRNPNSIQIQTLSITLPKDPKAASKPNCVRGEVGIALTGVAIFDGFDATLRDAVAHEVQDTYGGHPQNKGEYHYHNIPRLVEALLPSSDGMTLVGYAYDGYGIYGSVENDKKLTNADLDECHGHEHQIVWDGKTVVMYHYHATDEFPYTVGCFHGTSQFKGPTNGGEGMQQNGGMNNQSRPSFPPPQRGGQLQPPPRFPFN